jgi:ribosome-associated protein
VERFRDRMAAALHVEKPRRPTRPSRAAKERRLTAKRQLSERKRNRRPDLDD